MALSREQMETHINEGRSVLVNIGGTKVQVTKIADLPSAAELAKGDPAAEQKVAANLLNEQARIQGELLKLGIQPVTLTAATPAAPAKNSRKKPTITDPNAGNGEGDDTGGESGDDSGDDSGDGADTGNQAQI
jgi:hypothetical protein